MIRSSFYVLFSIFLSSMVTAQGAAKEADQKELKNAATKFVQQIDSEMKKGDAIIARYKKQGTSPEVPNQGRKFIELASYAEKTFGSDSAVKPLGQCGAFGVYAQNYWQDRLFEKDSSMLSSSKQTYSDLRKYCLDQIREIH